MELKPDQNKRSLSRPILRWLGHQKWIRFGLRDRLIRHCHPPDLAVSEKFEVPFFSLFYTGDFSNFLDWSVFYYGSYAGEELSLMRDFIRLKKEPIVLDVGANVGHHSLFASTIATRVHAFEPFPLVASKISEKITRNDISNITIHPTGLGESEQKLPYFPPTSNNLGTGSFHKSSSTSTILEFQIVRGDDYLSSIGVPKVDFIKIDVEGFEVSALKGLAETIKCSRPVCFFEWSQNERQSSDFDPRLLFPHDFLFFEFNDRKTIACIFQISDYNLQPIYRAWPDGNIVAIPSEFCEQHGQSIPALTNALINNG